MSASDTTFQEIRNELVASLAACYALRSTQLANADHQSRRMCVLTMRVALTGILFASGFASMIYQIVWQRLLLFTTGTDSGSLTLIVTGFMIGLGLGSLVGGYVADRVRDRHRLWCLVTCELVVALFASVSVTLYYEAPYSIQAAVWPWPAVAIASIVLTIVPAFFMGASLPLVARIVNVRNPAVGQWPASLYGFNAMGAAAGALVTVEILVPSVGLNRAVSAGALINLTCATITACLALRESWASAGGQLSARSEQIAAARSSLLPLLVASALSGFVGMALEVVWFRMLSVLLQANAATFGHLLTVYLAGLGLGSVAAHSQWIRRWQPERSFCLMQALIAIYAAGTPLLVAAITAWLDTDVIQFVLSRWTRLEIFGPPAAAIMIVGLPATMMGLSIGSLFRAMPSNLNRLGRHVGWLQIANIVGAVAGALATGFVFLNAVGTTGTLRIVGATGLLFLTVFLRQRPIRARVAALVTVGTAIQLAIPTQLVLWSRFQRETKPVIVVEDATGVASVGREAEGMVLLVNGQPQSAVPYGGIHTALGALPVLLHPNPARVAVVGIGSGDTTYAIGGRAETIRIDNVEIVAAVLDALHELSKQHPYAGLRRLLMDTRIRHHVADGRAFLSRAAERYDVIEADALLPENAYAGNVYSREYFTLVRERLNSGGLAVTWLPTERVTNTLRSVFPYVLVVGDIGIGSDGPVHLDRRLLHARLTDPKVLGYYHAAGIDIEALLDSLLLAPKRAFGPGDALSIGTDLNEDLFPRDEFQVPMILSNRRSEQFMPQVGPLQSNRLHRER